MAKPIILNDKNLENNNGWLFSPSLGYMVREHELGNNKWDVEVDSYTNHGTASDPAWENDQKFFDSAKTVAALITANPALANVQDWISGDKINFL